MTKKIGRNAPCKCGSGKKYKHCCLRADEQSPEPPLKDTPAMRIHQRDERLKEKMLKFAVSRFGPDYLEEAFDICLAESEEIDDNTAQFAVPWALYHYAEEGPPVAQLYLAERRTDLDPADRAWIEAQGSTYFSIWEVEETQPGKGLALHDLFTGATCFVEEQRLSRVLGKYHAILARVVTMRAMDGFSVIAGIHPRPLSPRRASSAVNAVREIGQLGEGRVAPNVLREPHMDLMLIQSWHSAVEILDHQPPPEIRNTDGEPFRLITDHFDFPPESRAQVEARLTTIEDLVREDEDGGAVFRFLRPENKRPGQLESTLIGTIRMKADAFQLETNSVQRADRLKLLIEDACGEMITPCSRAEEDTKSMLREAMSKPAVPEVLPEESEIPQEQSPEMLAILRQHKERHYKTWVDESLPALDGSSPREAMKTARGRKKLDLLLKEMEFSEARMPKETRYDFSKLRRRLGM